jgi:hypothetical protein
VEPRLAAADLLTMDQTLAYQIGAMFLLAALFMAGSRAKSLLGWQTLRALRMIALITGGALFAYIGYQKWPDIYAMARSAVVGPEPPAAASTASEAAPSGATAPAGEVHRRAKAPATSTGPQYILYTAPETPAPSPLPASAAPAVAVSPAAVIPATPAEVPAAGGAIAPESGNRGKRVIKSVGRFLHIGGKKPPGDDPGRP